MTYDQLHKLCYIAVVDKYPMPEDANPEEQEEIHHQRSSAYDVLWETNEWKLM